MQTAWLPKTFTTLRGYTGRQLAADLQAGRLPEMSAIATRFAPDPARVAHVVVHLVPLNLYEDLVGSGQRGEEA